LCRYSYGSNRCAHRMVDAGVCTGERNCMERLAPSYHSRAPVPRAAEVPEHIVRSAGIDLRLVDLGSPLTAGGGQ
jgi:hypothetical protein